MGLPTPSEDKGNPPDYIPSPPGYSAFKTPYQAQSPNLPNNSSNAYYSYAKHGVSYANIPSDSGNLPRENYGNIPHQGNAFTSTNFHQTPSYSANNHPSYDA